MTLTRGFFLNGKATEPICLPVQIFFIPNSGFYISPKNLKTRFLKPSKVFFQKNIFVKIGSLYCKVLLRPVCLCREIKKPPRQNRGGGNNLLAMTTITKRFALPGFLLALLFAAGACSSSAGRPIGGLDVSALSPALLSISPVVAGAGDERAALDTDGPANPQPKSDPSAINNQSRALGTINN